MIDAASAGSRRLTRRQMIRRLVGGAGAGMVCAGMGAANPIRKHLLDDALMVQADAQVAATSWQPIFLNPPQNETLIVVAERMVPNSSKAQVNRIIDLLLSVDTLENQKKFADSLSAIDHESRQHFGQTFKTIAEAQQNELLAILTAEAPDANSERDAAPNPSKKPSSEAHRTLYDHFENLKSWITGVYFSTEIGMRELGWTGKYFFGSFPGCQHPEGHS